MGIVVEYADASGEPHWIAPPMTPWHYTIFGESRAVAEPDETIRMVFGKINGGPNDFNRWTVNGEQFESSTPIALHEGRRYRLTFENQTDDPIPCTGTAAHSRSCASTVGQPLA